MRHSADELSDLEAIKRVKAQYFYFLDNKRWDDLRSIFTEDVDFDAAKRGEYQFDGLDHFIEFASTGLQPPAISVHHGHMPIIDLLGNDEATGVWAMMDYVETPAPGGGTRKFVGYGHYHERYRRDGDRWKISAWCLTRLRVDVLS
jgi:hypothetical protein